MYRWLTVPAVLLLGACATTPPSLKGDFADVSPRGIQRAGAQVSQPVRWGGSIVNTIPENGQTCFVTVSRPLDKTGRPRSGDKTLGRFIACAKGFYEPEVYARHREITVVGRLAGVETKDVGGYSYPYPKVIADTVYLWGKRAPAVTSPVYQFYPSPYALRYPYAIGAPYFYPYGGHYNGLLYEPNLSPFQFYGPPMYFHRHAPVRRRQQDRAPPKR